MEIDSSSSASNDDRSSNNTSTTSIESAQGSSSSSSPAPISNNYEEEEEEEDVCRICRNTGDADNPLRYPCACSGSIKFVHQECLLQWINHSNARQCEVSSSFSRVLLWNLPFRVFVCIGGGFVPDGIGVWIELGCVWFELLWVLWVILKCFCWRVLVGNWGKGWASLWSEFALLWGCGIPFLVSWWSCRWIGLGGLVVLFFGFDSRTLNPDWWKWGSVVDCNDWFVFLAGEHFYFWIFRGACLLWH